MLQPYIGSGIMQNIELSPVAAFLLRVNIITVPAGLIGVGMLQAYPVRIHKLR